MPDFHDDQFGQEFDDRCELETWLMEAAEVERFLGATALGVTVEEEDEEC